MARAFFGLFSFGTNLYYRKRKTNARTGNEGFSWHGELDGPGVRGEVVSEKAAGGRSTGVVFGALQPGGSELELLRRARAGAGEEMVRADAGRIRVRRQTPSAALAA